MWRRLPLWPYRLYYTVLLNALESLSEKGLVVDLYLDGRYMYMPSPMAIGIFEFTMMRTGQESDSKKWAELFHDYLQGDNAFYRENAKDGARVSLMRTVPHIETIREDNYVEILDYEKWEIQEMREGCEFYRTLEISTLNDFYLLFYFSFSFFVHLETKLQVANF